MEGALSPRAAVLPVRSTSASSMQSPPAGATRVSVARVLSEVNVVVTSSPSPRCWARVTARGVGDVDARAAQMVASFGCSSFRVGLVSAKPLSPFLTISARRYSYLFGGLGFRRGFWLEQRSTGSGDPASTAAAHSIIAHIPAPKKTGASAGSFHIPPFTRGVGSGYLVSKENPQIHGD